MPRSGTFAAGEGAADEFGYGTVASRRLERRPSGVLIPQVTPATHGRDVVEGHLTSTTSL